MLISELNQNLTEVNMSASALKSFLTTPFAQAANVGFEFEFIVPGLEDVGGNSNDPEFLDLEKNIDFPAGDNWQEQVIAWFDAAPLKTNPNKIQTSIKHLERHYKPWLKVITDNFLNSRKCKRDILNTLERLVSRRVNKDAIIRTSMDTKDELYTKALDQVTQNFLDNYGSFTDYASDVNIDLMSDFCNYYNIKYPYRYIKTMTLKKLVTNFKQATGFKIKGSEGYHDMDREPNLWIFEPDSSIEDPTNVGKGIELVSPPMPLPTGLAALNTVWDWVAKNDIKTNDSTGMHIGVSIPKEIYVNIDYLKLILFLGDKYVLKTFGRENNTYADTMMTTLSKNAKELKKRDKDFNKTLKILKSGVENLAKKAFTDKITNTSDRYVAVNIKDDYIEFRAAGGNYLEKKEAILLSLARYIRAMAVASDPTAFKEEYSKKLYKFIITFMKNQTDGLDMFVKYAAGEITPRQLKLLLKQKEIDILSKKLEAKKAALLQLHREGRPASRRRRDG